MLARENFSVHCAPKYHGTVRNLLEFLLLFQIQAILCYLLKFEISLY